MKHYQREDTEKAKSFLKDICFRENAKELVYDYLSLKKIDTEYVRNKTGQDGHFFMILQYEAFKEELEKLKEKYKSELQ